MITINEVQFAENDAEFVGSLFSTGGTCSGYYKRLKNSIKLLNAQKELIGVITKYGVLARADKLDDGKYWYSYGNIDLIGGIVYSEVSDLINELSTSKKYLDNGEKTYTFK